MSATIDPHAFVAFLGPSKTRVIYVEGRRYPIKILSAAEPSVDYVADAASTCIQVVQTNYHHFNPPPPPPPTCGVLPQSADLCLSGPLVFVV